MSFVCDYCQQQFARKYGLSRHLNENRCKALKNKQSRHPKQDADKSMSEHIIQLEKQIEQLKEQTDKEITTLKQKPTNTVNQVLQVICISNQDNYLDMLTHQMGDVNQAIEYIKDCALSDLSGDCKLIEKIYMSHDNENIQFLDRTKTKVSYYNEKNEKIVDNKDNFGKKLANNLQNSYLKGINYIINKNLVENISPNHLLDEYDIQTWNSHIYNLSDLGYQRKIVTQLNLPKKAGEVELEPHIK